MAIALLGHGSQYRSADGADDLTLNYTSHDGFYRKMITIITTVSNTSGMMVSNVTYNKIVLTQLGSGFQMEPSLNYKNIQIFYLEEGFFTTGSHDLIAELTGTVSSIIMEVIEISGATQGIPNYNTNDVASDDINEMQVPTTIDNTWIISGFWNTIGANSTPESGQTEVEDIGLGVRGNALAMSYYNITPPNAAADSNWSISSAASNYQICITIPPIRNKNSAILAATF